MEFESLGVNRAQLLSINQISVLEPEKYRDNCPEPASLPEAVYPNVTANGSGETALPRSSLR